MTENKYIQTENLLTSSNKFCIKLGLTRISKILDLFDNPQNKINVIHIAGTNGKGSVSAMIAEILTTTGYKTALYTSPHLFKYTERFKINGQDIDENIFSEYISEVEFIAQKNNIDLTEFEILTVVAYKYFYDEKVDFAIMETGLGGRFDATNVVKNPIASLITSISIDHKDRLGDTIDKIAYEKSGIIKSLSPVFINADNKGKNVIQNIANEKNSQLFFVDKNVRIKFENDINYAVFDDKCYEFALWGLHQKQNLSLVLSLINYLKDKGVKISENNIKSALKTVFIPARFQYNKKYNLIIDGSHNVDAAKILRRNLDFYFPNLKRFWMYGTLSTKEYDKVVNILFREGDTVCPVKFSHSLSVETDLIVDKINHRHKIHFEKYTKTANTLNFFLQGRLNIVTGSFYMIGELANMAIISN